MNIKIIPTLITAALLLAPPAISAQAQAGPRDKVVTRRGDDAGNPSTRMYTNVPGVGVVGYTDAETRWINQVDQLLGQYQQQNPHPVGSAQWINYVDSLVAWYQEQNPFQFGTANWRVYNNRIVEWYLRQNPFQEGTPTWQTYAGRISGTDQSQVYARPRQITFDEYMQNVYNSNPYAYGSPEWNQYVNYYINEYNRLYRTSDVRADGKPLTPHLQQFPQQQPWKQPPTATPAQPDWTQPPSTRPEGKQPRLPLNWAERPWVHPPTAYPQQDWTHRPGGVVTPQQQQMAPQTVPPSVGGSTGMTPMAPAPGAIRGGTAGGGGRR